MAEYHVGCGALEIYAGRLNKNKTMWIEKNEVTDEAISAVAQYLVENNIEMEFVLNCKKYRMKVSEVEPK